MTTRPRAQGAAPVDADRRQAGPPSSGSAIIERPRPTAVLARVDRDSISTGETGQDQARAISGVHGQGADGPHSHQSRETRRPCLLHDLEARPTRHPQHLCPPWRRCIGHARRERSIEQECADDLVDRVVAADVLANHDHVAVTIERRGGMGPARASEEVLVIEHRMARGGQDPLRDGLTGPKRIQSFDQGFDLFGAADPTR